jgi:hypothetical protein
MPASSSKPATSQTDRRRRRHPRYRSDFQVAVTFLLGNNRQKLEGHCTDLSEAGIGILVAAELNVGEVVALGFALAVAFPRELRAVLRYRRGYHYGFEFLSLTGEQQETLKGYLISLKPVD